MNGDPVSEKRASRAKCISEPILAQHHTNFIAAKSQPLSSTTLTHLQHHPHTAKMTKRTKKVGITGKYGTRYGASLRKQVKKMEVRLEISIDREAVAHARSRSPSTPVTSANSAERTPSRGNYAPASHILASAHQKPGLLSVSGTASPAARPPPVEPTLSRPPPLPPHGPPSAD